MKRHLALGSALAVLMTATPALANYAGTGNSLHSDSFYGSVTGDIIWPDSQSISGTSNGSVHYHDSYGGQIAGGFSSGPWRGELEGGYRDLRLKSATVAGVTRGNSSKASLWTLMANGYYDLYTGTRFTPYIGAGIGWARAGLPASAGFGNIDSHDNRFAYQGLLGVSYTPETMPQTDWSLGYRYLGTTNLKYSTPTGGITESDLKTHSLELGLRYHF